MFLLNRLYIDSLINLKVIIFILMEDLRIFNNIKNS